MPDEPSAALGRSPAATHLTICAAHRFTLWQAPSWFAPRLRERWPETQVVHVPGYDALAPELPLMNIFVGFSLHPEQLALAPRLRWIHSTAAGIAQLTYTEVRERGIVVTNARGIHAGPMAEHVLGMLIALARLVQPLGMRVWASTLSGLGDSSLVERILPASAFDEALADADFVLLAAPETPATKAMMGAPQFARMKRAAYLINVSRGSLVDEPALIAALENRTVAGAALDVASSEPLSPESPLWRLPNVFITPHLSAASEPLWERQAELLIDNLDRWFSARELRNVVNLEAGY
jgi:phosphoglycerate dehydrogenase-like enzyme